MSPQQIQQIFEPLRLAIIAREYEDADAFELIGGAIMDNPQGAFAYSMHMRDFIFENQTRQFSWSEAIAEVYRRTYFDIDHARKYGTEGLVEAGEDTLRKFVEYIVGSLNMDSASTQMGQPDLFVGGASH